MAASALEQSKAYLSLARIDHWFKNAFVIPGVIMAIYANHALLNAALFPKVFKALLAVCLIASAYYVLNEILDAESDATHPTKKYRAVPTGKVDIRLAYLESAFLAAAGLIVAFSVNKELLCVCIVLLLMACLYNVKPFRLKDIPYLDVLSESVNNPMRLLIGWYCTGIDVLPPVSLVMAYWMVGAFFMAVKRFAEYRRINDPQLAMQYRRSFSHYNEERLLVSITYYGVAFGLFFGIFLVRYRVELLLSVPLIAGFIAWYIHLGFLPDSPTQAPEKLFRQTWFTAYACLCVIVMVGLLFIDEPIIEKTFVPTIPVQSPWPIPK